MSCDAPPTADDLMQKKARYDRSQTCIKCKTARGNLVIKHAVYCSACLPAMLVRKFRRALSTSLNGSRPTRSAATFQQPPSDVLLALSGGPSSTVLLDVVSHCFSARENPKASDDKSKATRLPDVGRIRAVHVDWSALGGQSYVEGIRVLCAERDVELCVVNGESAFDPTWWVGVTGGQHSDGLGARIDPSSDILPFLPSSSFPPSPLDALRSYLSHLPTSTSIPPTLDTLTRILISYTASSLPPPCSVVLYGTCLPRLAISLFGCISSGGGFSLGAEREELGVKEVKIARPLVEWSAKEVGWWIYHRRLASPRPINGKVLQLLPSSGGKTITKLTEDFIMSLERDYPSTVNAISRTCAKVIPTHEPSHICILCRRPAQSNAASWKSHTALPSLRSSPSPVPDPSPHSSLSQQLCYACLTHLTSRGGVGAKRGFVLGSAEVDGKEEEGMQMPVWVRKVGDREMRDSIGEFLLDEEG